MRENTWKPTKQLDTFIRIVEMETTMFKIVFTSYLVTLTLNPRQGLMTADSCVPEKVALCKYLPDQYRS